MHIIESLHTKVKEVHVVCPATNFWPFNRPKKLECSHLFVGPNTFDSTGRRNQDLSFSIHYFILLLPRNTTSQKKQVRQRLSKSETRSIVPIVTDYELATGAEQET